MSRLPIVLRLAAPVFVLVGALHLFLGAGADVLLGAHLPIEALSDPALDSQNRFYGVAFTLCGFLFYLGAGDPHRYKDSLDYRLRSCSSCSGASCSFRRFSRRGCREPIKEAR
jgi:hypothetical protein